MAMAWNYVEKFSFNSLKKYFPPIITFIVISLVLVYGSRAVISSLFESDGYVMQSEGFATIYDRDGTVPADMLPEDLVEIENIYDYTNSVLMSSDSSRLTDMSIPFLLNDAFSSGGGRTIYVLDKFNDNQYLRYTFSVPHSRMLAFPGGGIMIGSLTFFAGVFLSAIVSATIFKCIIPAVNNINYRKYVSRQQTSSTSQSAT